MDKHIWLKRMLDLPPLLAKKSFFLFGPRATGKSSLIESQLGDKALVLDLLQSDEYLLFMQRPGALEGIIEARRRKGQIVVIDEIQKVPELLDEVHRLIEKKKNSLHAHGK